MELINFYFAKYTNRYLLLISVYYLITTVIITQRIVNLLGYHFQRPKEITVGVVIDFVLSAEVLVPMLVFTMYTTLVAFTGVILLNLLYTYLGPIVLKNHSSTSESLKIRKQIEEKGWAVALPHQIVKGQNYADFSKFMEDQFNDSFNVFLQGRGLWIISFNSVLVLGFCMPSTTVLQILLWICILGTIILTYFVFYLILQLEYKPYYQMFVNHLENPDHYAYPPPYFQPALHKRIMEKKQKKATNAPSPNPQ